jgi:hypothetical protein
MRKPIARSYEVPHDEDGGDAGEHEGRGRRERPGRQTRQAAHAVAAGAARAVARADPDQQAGGGQHPEARIDSWYWTFIEKQKHYGGGRAAGRR